MATSPKQLHSWHNCGLHDVLLCQEKTVMKHYAWNLCPYIQDTNMADWRALDAKLFPRSFQQTSPHPPLRLWKTEGFLRKAVPAFIKILEHHGQTPQKHNLSVGCALARRTGGNSHRRADDVFWLTYSRKGINIPAAAYVPIYHLTHNKSN